MEGHTFWNVEYDCLLVEGFKCFTCIHAELLPIHLANNTHVPHRLQPQCQKSDQRRAEMDWLLPLMTVNTALPIIHLAVSPIQMYTRILIQGYVLIS